MDNSSYSKKIFMEKGIRVAKPKWLRRPLPSGPQYEKIRRLLQKGGLNTVCSNAKCPNQFECYSKGTATFLIMGEKCTRGCRFCNIDNGTVLPPDTKEPSKVAMAAKEMGLKYAVVTSVTRDDLPDGGASFFAETIKELRQAVSGIKVEVLIPDFKGDESSIDTVMDALPDVLNHNVETVKRLYSSARPEAVYERSLELLSYCKKKNTDILVKSGLMVGLGETCSELEETISDIRDTGVDFLTIGQYLQPTAAHLPVAEFIPPEQFEYLRSYAKAKGFKGIASGPFVRSSYHAAEMFES